MEDVSENLGYKYYSDALADTPSPQARSRALHDSNKLRVVLCQSPLVPRFSSSHDHTVKRE